jgi:hypothetical protein
MPSWIQQSAFWRKSSSHESKYGLLTEEEKSGTGCSSPKSSDDDTLISERVVVNIPSRRISERLLFFVIGVLSVMVVIMGIVIAKQVSPATKSPVPNCEF